MRGLTKIKLPFILFCLLFGLITSGTNFTKVTSAADESSRTVKIYSNPANFFDENAGCVDSRINSSNEPTPTWTSDIVNLGLSDKIPFCQKIVRQYKIDNISSIFGCQSSSDQIYFESDKTTLMANVKCNDLANYRPTPVSIEYSTTGLLYGSTQLKDTISYTQYLAQGKQILIPLMTGYREDLQQALSINSTFTINLALKFEDNSLVFANPIQFDPRFISIKLNQKSECQNNSAEYCQSLINETYNSDNVGLANRLYNNYNVDGSLGVKCLGLRVGSVDDDKNNCVAILQQNLKALGEEYLGIVNQDSPGIFGANTLNALEKFQNYFGHNNSRSLGSLDNITLTVLQQTLATAYANIDQSFGTDPRLAYMPIGSGTNNEQSQSFLSKKVLANNADNASGSCSEKTLKEGSAGLCTKLLNYAMALSYDFAGISISFDGAGPDGSFCNSNRICSDKFLPTTTTAVKKFQELHNINPSGNVGSVTWVEISKTLDNLCNPASNRSYPVLDSSTVRTILCQQSVQTMLKLAGFWVGDVYDKGIVTKFQTLYGLGSDGIVGPQTWNILTKIAFDGSFVAKSLNALPEAPPATPVPIPNQSSPGATPTSPTSPSANSPSPSTGNTSSAPTSVPSGGISKCGDKVLNEGQRDRCVAALKVFFALYGNPISGDIYTYDANLSQMVVGLQSNATQGQYLDPNSGRAINNQTWLIVFTYTIGLFNLPIGGGSDTCSTVPDPSRNALCEALAYALLQTLDLHSVPISANMPSSPELLSAISQFNQMNGMAANGQSVVYNPANPDLNTWSKLLLSTFQPSGDTNSLVLQPNVTPTGNNGTTPTPPGGGTQNSNNIPQGGGNGTSSLNNSLNYIYNCTAQTGNALTSRTCTSKNGVAITYSPDQLKTCQDPENQIDISSVAPAPSQTKVLKITKGSGSLTVNLTGYGNNICVDVRNLTTNTLAMGNLAQETSTNQALFDQIFNDGEISSWLATQNPVTLDTSGTINQIKIGQSLLTGALNNLNAGAQNSVNVSVAASDQYCFANNNGQPIYTTRNSGLCGTGTYYNSNPTSKIFYNFYPNSTGIELLNIPVTQRSNNYLVGHEFGHALISLYNSNPIQFANTGMKVLDTAEHIYMYIITRYYDSQYSSPQAFVLK